MTAKWDYKVTSPDLPPGATSPRMGYDDVRWWLDTMDRKGWEYVGQAIEQFHGDDIPQTFWIFRRPHKPEWNPDF